MSEKPEKRSGIVHVGIDLGTSRSSVSTSTGARHVVASYVGWPVDMVARKVLKKKVLIGDEALENRRMVDLRRPLEQGLIKEGSEKETSAVRELVRHLLTLATGVAPEEREGLQIRAVVGVPAEAMRVNKQHLRNALKGLVDSLMIVSEPFAVAYGKDELLDTLVIDIGAGTADLCVMNGRYPTEEDQRSLINAGDWIDNQLQRLIRERYPEAQFTVHMVREWKEKNSFVGKPPKDAIKVKVPIQGKPTEIDITQELKAACEALIPPLSEVMLDLVSKVEPEYQERVRHNVLLAGGSALIQGLPQALERVLTEVGGGKVRIVEDPVFAGSNGGLAIALDAPDSAWERLAS
jgi:rod shape-determining protein MreB